MRVTVRLLVGQIRIHLGQSYELEETVCGSSHGSIRLDDQIRSSVRIDDVRQTSVVAQRRAIYEAPNVCQFSLCVGCEYVNDSPYPTLSLLSTETTRGGSESRSKPLTAPYCFRFGAHHRRKSIA